MALDIQIDCDLVVCTGSDIKFIKVKSEITRILGCGHVLSRGRETFTFPLNLAPHVDNLLKARSSIIPPEMIDIKERFQSHAKAREESMSIIEQKDVKNIPEFWLNILDPAQAVAVSSMIVDGLMGLCLFDEQGIGKTVMTIAAFDILFRNKEIEKAIIVCPKTMIHGWADDYSKFIPEKYSFFVFDGNKDSKRILSDQSDIWIINFECLARYLTVICSHASSGNTLLIVDESYYIKNKEAQRSAAVSSLRRSCFRAFVLCGTPAPNSPDDVIHQFNIADNGYTFGTFSPESDPEANRKRITDLVDSRGTFIRRLKQDVLPNLPKKEFDIISVSLTGRQAMLYEESRNNLELKLRRMDNSEFKRSLATYFQQRAALLQICVLPQMIDPLYSEVSAKYSALDDLIAKLVDEQKRKLVIWSVYTKSIDYAISRYNRLDPLRLDGSQKASDRQGVIDRFQNDPKALLCIANPMAVGAGITLHAAADAVYLSYSNQAAHFFQSIDRIHRRGQKSNRTKYYLVVCENTIEEAEVIRLKNKAKSQQDLLGDRVSYPDSLEEALAEITILNP